MKAQLERLAARFNALAIRERALIFGSVLVAVLALFYLMALEPSLVQKRRLAGQLADAQKGLQTLLSLKTPAEDPLAQRRAERDALRRQLADVDKTMAQIQRGLVPPERTAKLLEDMLRRSRGLQLVSLRTLPVKRFDAASGASAESNAAQDAERQLYQHTFEMTVHGSYVELYEYLRMVEQLPWRLFWSRISVAVNTDQQLRLVVTLTVHHSQFSRTRLRVPAGLVRFVVRNTDPIDHELIIGDRSVQDRHERGTEPRHPPRTGEVTVPAGGTAGTVYVFAPSGSVLFGCHLPGHWAYGMHGEMSVTYG